VEVGVGVGVGWKKNQGVGHSRLSEPFTKALRLCFMLITHHSSPITSFVIHFSVDNDRVVSIMTMESKI